MICKKESFLRSAETTECCCCCIFTQSSIQISASLRGSCVRELSAPFPGRDVICERCFVLWCFPAWSCRSHCLEQTEEKTSEKENKRGRGTKAAEIWIVGYWPYHAYMLAFLYNAFSRFVSLKQRLNWRLRNTKQKKEKKKREHITPLFDICCFVVFVETVHQFRSQQL